MFLVSGNRKQLTQLAKRGICQQKRGICCKPQGVSYGSRKWGEAGIWAWKPSQTLVFHLSPLSFLGSLPWASIGFPCLPHRQGEHRMAALAPEHCRLILAFLLPSRSRVRTQGIINGLLMAWCGQVRVIQCAYPCKGVEGKVQFPEKHQWSKAGQTLPKCK